MSSLSQEDLDYCIALAGCSLDESPGSNWVQESGGLPEYICEIARSVKKTGKTTSQAIAIAVSRIKAWAAGGSNVNADTRAKAAKALAEWESKKAKSKAKKVAMSNGVSLKPVLRPVEMIALCGASFNVDRIRAEFERFTRQRRADHYAANPYTEAPWEYVKEIWNTHLIVAVDNDARLYKIDYSVDDSGNVSFGEPVEVVVEYVEAGKSISDDALEMSLRFQDLNMISFSSFNANLSALRAGLRVAAEMGYVPKDEADKLMES